MGKIVALWSDIKSTGKSVITYILANQMKEMGNKDLKILVCCLNLKYSLLYKLFKINTSEVGLEELINYQTLENESAAIVGEIIPQSNGISFIGTYRTTNSYALKNIDNFKKVLEKLKESYDLIIFDTVSGKENVLTNAVLEKADIILKLFVQDNESIQGLSRLEEENNLYNQEIIYIVSKYRNIYPRHSDIKRRFSLKNMYKVEYCETLQEMKNRDSLHLYLQRETECNTSIRHVSRYILESLGLSQPPDSFIKERPLRYLKNLISSIF